MSTNAATKTLPRAQKPDYQATTLRVPLEVWQAVSHEAINRRIAAQDIWIEAVRKYLKLAA